MHDFDWSSWTDWTPLATLDLKTVPVDPGAYVIAANKPICRAVGTDPIGLLDVGESDGLRQRLKDFLRCMRRRGDEGHMAGWRFAFFRFERHFPVESLRVRWVTTVTKEAAYALEGRILLEYIKAHCELPPLNYKFNWHEFGAMKDYFSCLGNDGE